MSSLQNNKVIIGSNDLAKEEIRRDRKVGIESGKLKGRRLFEAEESEAEVGFFGEREEVISSVTSYGHEGKGSSTCEGSEEEKVVGVSVEKVKGDEISFVKGGGERWMVMIKGWFCVVLMVFAMGVIFMRCNGGCRVEDEVMLVPT